MRKLLLICFLVTLFLSANTLLAQTARPAFMYNPRSLAMGGTGVASARGAYSYIYNPALLIHQKFSINIPGVYFEAGEKLFDLLDFVVDNKEKFRKLNKSSLYVTHEEKAEIIKELRNGGAEFDNIWHRGTAVPAVGFVFKNFAFSIYNVANFSAKIDVGIIVPKVKVYAIDDLVFSSGYARQVNDKLTLGLGMKFIKRFESQMINIQVEEMSNMGEIVDEAVDEMEQAKYGYGFDIGALYQLTDNLELAAMAQDLLGDIEDVSTPFNFKLGMLYHYGERWLFAADLEDFFNHDGDKLVNKLYIGSEYKLPILKLRFGFGQGYPAIGVGLNLKVLELDYTYYSREITDSPGTRGEGYHVLGLNLGWR